MTTRLAPATGWAIHGTVLGPQGWADGYLTIEGAAVTSISRTRPPDIRVIEAERSLVMPGLIDLHGHPEYNIFSAWEPPQTFPNRYAWRSDPSYKVLVAGPMSYLEQVTKLRPLCARYAEMRALVGGATAIQGASPFYPDPSEALVRNVDLSIFSRQRACSFVDFPKHEAEAAQIRADIDAGKLDRIYIHLAEGVDQSSSDEFERLCALNWLGPWTVVIHGTALTSKQLGAMAEVGARLVWSPQSNLRLYGSTTRAAEAMALGIEVGLGADWLPSGSRSLLDEAKVARRVLHAQGLDVAPRKIVEMVTSTAARIAGLDDELGTLSPGAPADICVLERRDDDPDESFLASDPSAVSLVAIGGDVAYARPAWWDTLFDAKAPESVIAWGTEMSLDTGFRGRPQDTPPLSLAEVRRQLLTAFIATGPIFA